jgi:hypothetical protein
MIKTARLYCGAVLWGCTVGLCYEAALRGCIARLYSRLYHTTKLSPLPSHLPTQTDNYLEPCPSPTTACLSTHCCQPPPPLLDCCCCCPREQLVLS